MSLLDTPLVQILSRSLDLTAQRQTLVSQNIANIDTPGYRTRDLDFQREMQRALSGDGDAAASPMVREVPGLVDRPDGNNVDIDRESLLMAKNQLQFQTAAQLLHSEFNRLQLAINGGSGQ
jgi:flagellar basal-body rod protein FlgB